MRYTVGGVYSADEARGVPARAKLEMTDSGLFMVTELPELAESEKVAEELKSGFSYLSYVDRLSVAEWILARFERKQDQPDSFRDRDDDLWIRDTDGTYFCQRFSHESGYFGRSYESAVEEFGRRG